MNKILVLDMDGVVNSDFYIKQWFAKKFLELETRCFTAEEARLEARKSFAEEFHHSMELIFPILAKRVSNICKQSDCSILWSSSWRRLSEYQDIELAKAMFNRRGLPGNRLIGYTPSFTMHDDGCRGSEIRSWLLNNTYGTFDRAAVLDDRYDAGIGLPDCAKFFQTTEEHGLTESIQNKVIQYLNE